MKGIRNPPGADHSLACAANEVEIVFSMNMGSSLRLDGDQEIKESYLPSIQVTKFRNGTEAGPSFYPFLQRSL
jgi:hypothetical protein